LVVSHIAVFEGCTDGMVFDFESADDLTEGPYEIEIRPAEIEDAEFSFSSDVIGDSNNVTISFTPATKLLESYGNIFLTIPV
jgi:hypothetical protein